MKISGKFILKVAGTLTVGEGREAIAPFSMAAL